MKQRTLICLFLTWAVVTLSGTAAAKNVTISIPIDEVVVRSGERGAYYVVKFDIPSDVIGKRLDTALIEFVVDATSTTQPEDELTPVVTVLPLTDAFTGANPRYESGVSSVRPVSVGENRRLTTDITGIVKGWIANPSSNHGLVIGALAGPAVGAVSLRSAALAPGTAIRVTFFYQNRFGNRVSSSE